VHPRTHFQHRSSIKRLRRRVRRAFPASSSVVLSRCAVSLARACPRPLRFCRLRSGRLVPLLRSQATWLRPRRRRQHGPRRRPRRNSDAASGLLKKRHMRRVSSTPSTRAYWPAHKSNCRGASSPLLNHDLHAIDATRARWRGVVVYYRSCQPAQPRSRRERTK
jgi:hypothetical protein